MLNFTYCNLRTWFFPEEYVENLFELQFWIELLIICLFVYFCSFCFAFSEFEICVNTVLFKCNFMFMYYKSFYTVKR